MTSSIRKCTLCGSCWPAMTTVEAYNNLRRSHRLHRGVQCVTADGELIGHPVQAETEDDDES